MTTEVQRLQDQILAFLREVPVGPLTADEIAADALPPIRSFGRGSHVIEEWSPGAVVLPHLQALRAEGKITFADGRWQYVHDPRTARIVEKMEASLNQQLQAPK